MYNPLRNVTTRVLVTVAVGAAIFVVGAWSVSGGGNDYAPNPNLSSNLNSRANVGENVESFASIKLAGCRGGLGAGCL